MAAGDRLRPGVQPGGVGKSGSISKYPSSISDRSTVMMAT
jgi:hypothetical protein